MEWLQDNIMVPLLGALAAWFWYDKRQRDSRFKSLEDRLQAQESSSAGHVTVNAVLESRLGNIEQIMEIKLGHIQESLNRLEEK
jgi:hypothetical protein